MFNPYEDPLCSEKHERRMARKNLAEGRCVYCGTTNGITKDHIRPKSRGGEDHPRNLQPLCAFCNKMKSAHTEIELKLIMSDVQDRGVWYQFEKPYQKYLEWLLIVCEERGHKCPLLK